MFRFKQFNVDQTGCAMKINTDGALLGALAKAYQPKTILDIGTGTGVIALMLAQRFSDAQIDAVEIDELAAETAQRNFNNSPFADRLSLYTDDFEAFLEDHPQKKYDLIVSNPPFYINSLESPGEKKSLAKHADADFFDRLIKSAGGHLSDDGAFWLILPLQTAELVKVIGASIGLKLQKQIRIFSYPDSEAHRKILVLSFAEIKEKDDQFIIYDAPKVYSQQYQLLLTPFFTIFE
ncbi:methyltransferase [Mucilaginibacter sp. dw_454]|uniref:tRNA1(Val) (adenine(37)-N6)-methyltransferase n=1 Tax=Mucilaginibacter sp. dw_454 TaxID=2720079 RepID=UPI001BD218B5|nr:methyltransferase [Mucilaginibacter sp. dw_454]